MKNYIHHHQFFKWLLFSVTAFSILFLAYVPDQSDFYLILPGYCIAYGSYLMLSRESTLKVKEIVLLGIAIRILLLFSIPSFSDDIYRYIWDGMLSSNGINPYAYTPSEIITRFPEFSGSALFSLLNSKNYYTVYPFLAQFLFFISGLSAFAGLSIQIMMMKGLIIVCEAGTVLLLPRLLQNLNLKPEHSFWYILNPLILVELNANAHLEAIMIFCLVAATYFYVSEKYYKAILLYLSAVVVKIIPLIFLPYILVRTNKKYWLLLIISAGISLFLILLPPVLSGNSMGILSSLKLYFAYFEFNASIYYLFRYIGGLIFGYNVIHTLGPLLAICSAFIILLISFKKHKAGLRVYADHMLLIGFVYLLCSTTIHPWYLSLIILLSVFSHYKFPVIWALMIYLSYSNYYGEIYHESIWLVFIEYIAVIVFFLYELKIYKFKKG